MTSNSWGVTEAECKIAYDLSSDANLNGEEANEYWQLVRYFRGQIYNGDQARRAIQRIRQTQR